MGCGLSRAAMKGRDTSLNEQIAADLAKMQRQKQRRKRRNSRKSRSSRSPKSGDSFGTVKSGKTSALTGGGKVDNTSLSQKTGRSYDPLKSESLRKAHPPTESVDLEPEESKSMEEHLDEFEQLKSLAQEGNADAQKTLALAFIGEGAFAGDVEPNRQVAITWFRRAARQGHPQATHLLGVLLLQNSDDADDAEQAAKQRSHAERCFALAIDSYAYVPSMVALAELQLEATGGQLGTEARELLHQAIRSECDNDEFTVAARGRAAELLRQSDEPPHRRLKARSVRTSLSTSELQSSATKRVPEMRGGGIKLRLVKTSKTKDTDSMSRSDTDTQSRKALSDTSKDDSAFVANDNAISSYATRVSSSRSHSSLSVHSIRAEGNDTSNATSKTNSSHRHDSYDQVNRHSQWSHQDAGYGRNVPTQTGPSLMGAVSHSGSSSSSSFDRRIDELAHRLLHSRKSPLNRRRQTTKRNRKSNDNVSHASFVSRRALARSPLSSFKHSSGSSYTQSSSSYGSSSASTSSSSSSSGHTVSLKLQQKKKQRPQRRTSTNSSVSSDTSRAIGGRFETIDDGKVLRSTTRFPPVGGNEYRRAADWTHRASDWRNDGMKRIGSNFLPRTARRNYLSNDTRREKEALELCERTPLARDWQTSVGQRFVSSALEDIRQARERSRRRQHGLPIYM
ncbi:MAG: hypothetical protein MHM6MM_002440 [Cercozoa sp. M6MM]